MQGLRKGVPYSLLGCLLISSIIIYVWVYQSELFQTPIYYSIYDQRQYDDYCNTAIYDLDNNGKLEFLEFKENGSRNYSVLSVFTTDGIRLKNSLVKDINIFKQVPSKHPFFVTEIANTGVIFYFYFEGDSLRIKGINYPKTEVSLLDLAVDEVMYLNDSIFSLSVFGFKEDDLDQDGNNEILFSINGGFGVHPRTLCLLDIEEKHILKSSSCGVGLVGNPVLIRPMSHVSISSDVYALGNSRSEIDFDDHSSYLVSWSPNTDSLGIHYSIQGQGSSVIHLSQDAHSVNIGISGPPNAPTRKILRFDTSWNIIDSFKINNTSVRFSSLAKIEDFAIYEPNVNQIRFYNHFFELKGKAFVGSLGVLHQRRSEGKEVLYYDSQNDLLTILDSNYVKLGTLAIKLESSLHKVSLLNSDELGGQLLLHLEKGWVHVSYLYNTFYSYRIIIIPAIILLLTIVLFIIWSIYRALVQKRRNERTLSLIHHQMEALGTRLDTHFIYNSLNRIDHMYREGQSAAASEYMERYSNLIRQTLKQSQSIIYSLHDELYFVKTYLSLQCLTSKLELFTMQFNPELDPELIRFPKHLLFNQIENLYKYSLGSNGRIDVYISEVAKEIIISVIAHKGSGEIEENYKSTKMGKTLDRESMQFFKDVTGKRIELSYNQDFSNSISKVTIRLDF